MDLLNRSKHSSWVHSTELDTVQKCKYSLIWSLRLWNGYSLWEMTLYPTQMKLLENKTIYNLVLNCVVAFTIIARGDLRKKRSKRASGAVDFMVGLQLGFKEWLEVWLGKESSGGWISWRETAWVEAKTTSGMRREMRDDQHVRGVKF